MKTTSESLTGRQVVLTPQEPSLVVLKIIFKDGTFTGFPSLEGVPTEYRVFSSCGRQETPFSFVHCFGPAVEALSVLEAIDVKELVEQDGFLITGMSAIVEGFKAERLAASTTLHVLVFHHFGLFWAIK